MPRKRKCETDAYNEAFPTRLREMMSRTKTTQETLGEVLQVSRQMISQYCSGASTPDWKAIAAMAKHFDVSADYLLGLTDVQKPEMDFRAVCDYTGLSAKAIESIVNNFKDRWNYELSDALWNELFIELFPALASLSETSQMVSDIIRAINEGETDDRSKFSMTPMGSPVVIRDGREADLNLFYYSFIDMRLQLSELSEKWSDFLESFIPTKDIVSAGRKIMREKIGD